MSDSLRGTLVVACTNCANIAYYYTMLRNKLRPFTYHLVDACNLCYPSPVHGEGAKGPSPSKFPPGTPPGGDD